MLTWMIATIVCTALCTGITVLLTIAVQRSHSAQVAALERLRGMAREHEDIVADIARVAAAHKKLAGVFYYERRGKTPEPVSRDDTDFRDLDPSGEAAELLRFQQQWSGGKAQ